MTDWIDDLFAPGATVQHQSKTEARRAAALNKAEEKQSAKYKVATEKFVAAWTQLQDAAGKGGAERFLYEATGLKSARRVSKDDEINAAIRFQFEFDRDFRGKFQPVKSVEQIADALLKSSVTGSRVALLKRINRVRDEMINAGELPADFKHTYTYDR
jgi:hypothetical protein